jgi:hypothetical protein
MATPILQARPGNFNFSPSIIPPSAGDLEEARIRQLMDRAKLLQLQQEPGLQQQHLNLAQQQMDLARQQASEQSSHNVATEAESNAMLAESIKQHATEALLRKMEIGSQERGQDIQQRGQDMTLQAENARQQGEEHRTTLQTRAQTTDALIHAMMGGTDIGGNNKQILAKVLALRGDPELQTAMGGETAVSDQLAQAKVKALQALTEAAKPKSSISSEGFGGGNKTLGVLETLAPYLTILRHFGK